MHHQAHRVVLVVLALLLASPLLTSPLLAAEPDANGIASARVLQRDAQGAPTWLVGRLGRLDDSRSAESARALLYTVLAERFAATGGEELHLQRVVADSAGRLHFRYEQRLHGEPVAGSELILHVDAASGEAVAVNGHLVPDPELAAKPGLPQPDAGTFARQTTALQSLLADVFAASAAADARSSGGLTMESWRQIAHDAAIGYLGPYSSPDDLRAGTLLAAAALYGEGSESYSAVGRVWGALGLKGLPEIRVQRHNGTNVADGGVFSFQPTLVTNLPISQLFDLCNDGTANLVIDNPNALVSGFGFTQIDTPPTTPVAPRTCTTFRVRFHVNGAGNYTGGVAIENNDANEDPFNFILSGTALPAVPEIRVRLYPQGTSVADEGSFTFPSTPAANLPISQQFEICNDGTGDLVIDNPLAMVGGLGFTQIGNSPLTPVEPGQCTLFRVRFHVNTPGFYTGGVTIQNNDINEDPYVIYLSGTAL